MHTFGVHRAVSFTFASGSCISGVACTAAHCSCDSQALHRGACSGAADCVAKATVQCLGGPSCHSFAFEGSYNKSSNGSTIMTFPYGGKGSAVANSGWQAY